MALTVPAMATRQSSVLGTPVTGRFVGLRSLSVNGSAEILIFSHEREENLIRRRPRLRQYKSRF